MLAGRQPVMHYVQFLGGSVICAVIYNATLIVGDWFGYGYVSLLVLGYALSLSFGYVYHCRVTFTKALSLSGYISFSAGIWLGVPFSLAILFLLGDMLHMPMWLAAPVTTSAMVIYHYCVTRLSMSSLSREI